MIYDLFWRICRLFVSFLSFFDRNIVAPDLWRIDIVRMVGLPCLPLENPDIQIKISASFTFARRLRAAGCTTGIVACAHNTYFDNHKPKVYKENEYPKLVVKVHAPFGSEVGYGRTSIVLTIRHKPSGISETRTVDAEFTKGILSLTIFINELLEQLTERILTWHNHHS